MPRLVPSTIFGVIALATPLARAQSIASPPAATPAMTPTTTANDPAGEPARWYGWQTITVDVVAAALIGGGAALDQRGLTGAGFVWYATASPLVHAGHGSAGKAYGSLAAHVAGPLIGGGLGTLSVFGSCDDDCTRRHAYVGVGVAMVVVTALDAILLGWEVGRVDPQPLVPAISMVRSPDGIRMTSVGLSGEF